MPLRSPKGLKRLLHKSGEGQQEIAEKMGMNRATGNQFLRLLKLPVKIKE